MAIATNKYENAILYLCKQQSGVLRGKKKLAKLLYYLDFDRYEYKESMQPVTGDTYKALPMGPFPEHMTVVIQGLEKAGKLISRAEESGYDHPTEIYECKSEPDLSVFDKDDVAILKRVATNYSHLSGKQLEDLTHAEAPYIGTEPSHEIPYDLAFYRGTDFNEILST
jgi:uncharacterized phage-associated protein